MSFNMYRPRDHGVLTPRSVDRAALRAALAEREAQKKAPGSRPGSKLREETPVKEGAPNRV
jgi:hypothetical protein